MGRYIGSRYGYLSVRHKEWDGIELQRMQPLLTSSQAGEAEINKMYSTNLACGSADSSYICKAGECAVAPEANSEIYS
jgi:hypothetical protein